MPGPENDDSSDLSSAGCDPGAHEELGSVPNKGVDVAPQEEEAEEDVKAEEEAKAKEASVKEEEVKDWLPVAVDLSDPAQLGDQEGKGQEKEDSVKSAVLLKASDPWNVTLEEHLTAMSRLMVELEDYKQLRNDGLTPGEDNCGSNATVEMTTTTTNRKESDSIE
jgi:hypothetical protein